MARIDELILYRDFEKGELLRGMNWIMEHYKDCQYRGEVRERFFGCMHELVDLAGNYGFENNLWHAYLTYLLVNNENVFSTSCEIKGVTEGSLLTDRDFWMSMYSFSVYWRMCRIWKRSLPVRKKR